MPSAKLAGTLRALSAYPDKTGSVLRTASAWPNVLCECRDCHDCDANTLNKNRHVTTATYGQMGV
jgi:hypothetical protein